MGRADTTTKASPAIAAWAKKASEAADQTDVARVWNPGGARMSVAGSSFMVRRKTRAAPARMPGATKGTVTVRSLTEENGRLGCGLLPRCGD